MSSAISLSYVDGRWYNTGPKLLWKRLDGWGIAVTTVPPFCQKCSLRLGNQP